MIEIVNFESSSILRIHLNISIGSPLIVILNYAFDKFEPLFFKVFQ